VRVPTLEEAPPFYVDRLGHEPIWRTSEEAGRKSAHSVGGRDGSPSESRLVWGVRMRRLAVAVVAAGITVPGFFAAAPAQGSAPSEAPVAAAIKWGPCSDPDLIGANAECGYLKVPLDYRHPNGTKISLAVSRVKHTSPDSKYQGVMLVNPGGPGGSGLSLALLGQFVPRHAGDTYDWIGFDPRGVGSSKPALSCLPNYFGYDRPPYIPGTNALVRIWKARSKAYATACRRNHAALLPHMKTIDSVRDMDRIRAALGVDQINYYGFSYGTYLAQVYATLFPSRLRRIVLDSNVNPNRVWYAANLDQDIAFNRNINIWFRWIAKHPRVYHLGKTRSGVRAQFYGQRAKLRRHPAGGVIGPDEWTDLFVAAGYYKGIWPGLAEAFAGWVHRGKWKPLKAWYDGSLTPGDDNWFAVYVAVQCTDVHWPQLWGRWGRDNWTTHRRAPFMTWANAWFNAPCLYWPARAGKPVEIDGGGVKSALLIGETLDAATPFRGSLVVRSLFPNSSLIAEPGGTTHAGSLSGNACVDNRIADYLATGKRPPRKPGNGPDTICRPLPPPAPKRTQTTSSFSTPRHPPRPLPRIPSRYTPPVP
jgi:pimeloyl-ACP methyl ester carboxylesterase